MRIALADAGDTMDDANFDEKVRDACVCMTCPTDCSSLMLLHLRNLGPQPEPGSYLGASHVLVRH